MTAVTTSPGPSATHENESPPVEPRRRFLLVGESDLAGRVCGQLHGSGVQVAHLGRPTDDDLSHQLSVRIDGVGILVHDDVAALRYALAISHLDPELPIVATIFDRTVGSEVRRMLSNVTVTSPATLAAPALTAACTNTMMMALVSDEAGRRAVARTPHGAPYAVDAPASRRWGRTRNALRVSPWRVLDRGARKLVIGILGLIGVLTADTAWLVVVDSGPLVGSFRDAVNVLATVGSGDSEHGRFYDLFSAFSVLLTIGLTATFTAGLVERLSGRRFIAFGGPRAVPRRNHVIVAGLGQVGLRLCLNLRAFGIPVVAVERNADADGVRLARSYQIPVVIGHAGDRGLLNSLNLRAARSVAAVGSDDLDNIAIAVAAHGVSADTDVVLRAGDQEAVAETRALLPLGTTVDVISMSAAMVTSALLHHAPLLVMDRNGDTFVSSDGVTFSRWLHGRARRCSAVADDEQQPTRATSCGARASATPAGLRGSVPTLGHESAPAGQLECEPQVGVVEVAVQGLRDLGHPVDDSVAVEVQPSGSPLQ